MIPINLIIVIKSKKITVFQIVIVKVIASCKFFKKHTIILLKFVIFLYYFAIINTVFL